GGSYVFAYGLFLQLGLLWILLRLFRWPIARVRRAGQRGMLGLFQSFPYGRQEFDQLDLSKPAVVVSNHQSSLDVILVLGFPGDVRLTTSPRVWDEPWLGFSARRLGHIRVDDDLLASCRAVVAEGASIHFYPEGTRSKDGYPARFRRGAFELAVQLGIDVLPVVICDSRALVPRDAYWVDWAHMAVRALPRVSPGTDSRALQKRVQQQVREGFAEEMARLNTAAYLRRKVRRLYRYQGWRVLLSVRATLAKAEVPERPAEPVVIEPCGFGVETLMLAECYPGIRIVARDADERSLAVARHAAAAHSRVSFEQTG
ncbi:MAG: lysophospholipid acyltransferase family protein, partial [Planctomycetota bacterium]